MFPSSFDNDANTAALGEYVYGAGRGYKNIVYVTVSTGIGGGIILNGEDLCMVSRQARANSDIRLSNQTAYRVNAAQSAVSKRFAPVFISHAGRSERLAAARIEFDE